MRWLMVLGALTDTRRRYPACVFTTLFGLFMMGSGALAEPRQDSGKAGVSLSLDTTWTKSGSPYILRGEVVVEEGATLTIEPGVKVRGTEGASLVVRGVLRVEGAHGDPVVFSRKKGHRDWKGITLLGESSVDLVDNRSRIRFSHIKDAVIGVRSLFDSPSVTNTIFRDNRIGLDMTSPNGDVLVFENVFLRNHTAFVGRTRGIITVYRNDFWDNRRNIVAGPKPTYDCGPDSGGWEIHENDILRGPSSSWYSNDVRTTPGSNVNSYFVKASRNWWGTLDGSDIEARILDANDDFRFKEVDAAFPSSGPHTTWSPPGAVGNPDPEPISHADALTISFVESPKHGECRHQQDLREISGRAQGHMGELRSVAVAVRRIRSSGCAWWSHRRSRLVSGPCSKPVWVDAEGTRDWSYRFRTTLPAGKYEVLSRSNGEGGFAVGRNKIKFRLKTGSSASSASFMSNDWAPSE
jgi:hypothetical protein